MARLRSQGSADTKAEQAASAGGAVGLRTVAKVAGVSTATVSRVINSPELVSAALRDRVSSVIDRLGWVPHGAARALATRRSNTIGAIFPTLTHGDFARALESLQSELTEAGYTLLLACSEYDLDREYQQVRKLVERGVDAVMLVGELHHTELASFLSGRGVPQLNAFVYNASSHGTCVGPDNHKALVQLTEYLIGLGHKTFGVIAQEATTNDRARSRLAGIRDTLADHALAVRPAHLVTGRWTIREGRALFRAIMSEEPKPTAVICGNAYLAVGAMLESQALGIDVPGSVSIAGYDDIELMSELPIPITTVRVMSDDVGRRAARHLMAMVEGRSCADDYECSTDLVIRASSGPPRSVATEKPVG